MNVNNARFSAETLFLGSLPLNAMADRWDSLAETLFLGSLPLSIMAIGETNSLAETLFLGSLPLSFNYSDHFLSYVLEWLWISLERVSWLAGPIFVGFNDGRARWTDRWMDSMNEEEDSSWGMSLMSEICRSPFSFFAEDGLWEENRWTGDERRVGERRRESGLGWANLRADFYQRAFNRIKTDNRSY